MIPALITESDIKEYLHLPPRCHRVTLEDALKAAKIPFHRGYKGRLSTTLDAINASLGLKSANDEPQKIEFE